MSQLNHTENLRSNYPHSEISEQQVAMYEFVYQITFSLCNLSSFL